MKAAFSFTAICGTFLLNCAGQEQPKPPTPPEPSPGVNPPLIIPQPKTLRMGAGVFRMPPGGGWKLRAATRDERLWRAAQLVFVGSPGSFEQTAQPWIGLEMGSCSSTNFPTGQSQPRWASDPEGYRLAVETNGLAIQSSTAQGSLLWPADTGAALADSR